MIDEVSLYEGTITADGDTKTAFQKVGEFQEANFFLYCSAKSGTTPTLDVDILTYSEITGQWYVVESFTQLTDTGQERKFVAGGLGGKIALKWTVGGTDPSFTVKVSGQFKML